MSNDSCRRRFLYETGVALTAGVLAGCSGGDGSSNGAGTTGDATTAGEATSPVATDTGTATESAVGTEMTEPSGTQPASRTEATAERSTTGGRTTGTTDGSSITEPAPAAVDEYLSDANFYDGDVVVGVPFVAVGIPGPKTGFDPAAIKVPVGTEVTWVWASDDQAHAVISANTSDGTRVLDSGTPEKGSHATYRHTFEEPGIYRYYCGVHRAQSARGAVVVAPADEVGDPEAG